MSPSQRLGGSVEASTDRPTPDDGDEATAAPPNGETDERGRRGSRRKRTTSTAGVAAPPARGTSSQRGASSSVVSRTLTEDDVPGPIRPTPAAERADTSSEGNGDSAEAPPSQAVATRGSTLLDRDAPSAVVAPAPPTTVMPAGEPAPPVVSERLLGPQIPTEPPPVTATISAHDIAPVPRVLGRRPRVRKVTRVVRHVDPWSVFKIAAVFNLILYGICLTAGVLLWNVAYATGTIDNMERFFESFGWDEFEFKGGEIFHNLWIAGLFGVVGLTGAAVLGATLFNLITDLVGGVRMTVLEEEVVERTTAPMRRFVVRRPTLDDSTPGTARPTPPPSPSGTPAGMIRPQRLARRFPD